MFCAWMRIQSYGNKLENERLFNDTKTDFDKLHFAQQTRWDIQ